MNAQVKISGVSIFLLLLCALLLSSMHASAQFNKRKRQVTYRMPVYVGFELAMGSQLYTLQSGIPQLHDLKATNSGVMLGMKYANSRAAFRAYGGWYYSGSSMRYTVDLLTAGVSGNIYLLGMQKMKKHVLEPYAVFSLSYQRSQFFGNYLPNDRITKNIHQQPHLGNLDWYSAAAGLGVEFQLENDFHDFVHLFAEVKYGMPFGFQASSVDFESTYAKNSINITVGVSCGKF